MNLNRPFPDIAPTTPAKSDSSSRQPELPLSRRSFLGRAARGAALVTAMPAVVTRAATGKAQKHVLLANCWHDINIGDIAHTPGILALIEQHLPEATVSLWPYPSYTNMGPQRHWAIAVQKMIQAAFPRITLLPPHGANNGRAVAPELIAAIERADLLIVGSGGFHAAPAAIWRAATRKPFGAYGVSVGESAKYPALYSEAAFLFGRDTPTVGFLKKGGVAGPVIEFGPDATFGLRVRDEVRAGYYLRQVGLEEKKFLCVVPRLRHSPYPEIYDYPPSADERERARVNAEFKSADHAAARELIVNWVRTTKLKVLACPEMTYGVPLSKEELVDPLPADVRPHVVWRDSFWLCDEAASVFAQALAVVSLDCHSPIIALANGTPAIHLRVPTDNKFKSRMFSDIGLPDWIQENAGMTGERLTQIVMDIHRDRPGAEKKVARAMGFVRERQAATMGTVRRVLSI